jgi:HK97 family phage major capsid protein
VSQARRLAEKAQAMFAAADREGRSLTPTEREQVEQLLDEARDHGRFEKQFRELGEQLGGGMPSVMPGGAPNLAAGALTPGEAFIRSDGYKAIQNAAGRPQQWTSGLVEVQSPQVALSAKGTLLESPGGGGGALVSVPYVVPGVVDQLFRPLVLEDLLLSGQATGNTVRYITQGTATSGAAGVAEGGLKPESTLGFATVDEPVKKIATSLVISDETLDDAPAIQSFINGQLTLFVRLESERQLLRGTSGGNEVQGLLTSRNVPIYTAGTAQGNIAEQLFKAANSMRGSATVEPDWFVVHPSDYEKLRLIKDNAGQLMGGGPWTGQYGTGGVAPASTQLTGAVDTLWGKPCYISPLIGSGTALVGTRAGAQIWRRGGLSVESTNSHSDHFFRNLAAIRAERRLALAVYRPSAYVEVRGLA